VKAIPIYDEFLRHVWYLGGPLMSAYLISTLNPACNEKIGGLTKATSFTRFCGLMVEDGKLARMKAGKLRDHCPFMRVQLFATCQSMMKGRAAHGRSCKYLDRWDETKARYVAKGDEDGRFKNDVGQDRSAKNSGHQAGGRDAARLFLEDLYVVWRSMLGLPLYCRLYRDRVKDGTVLTLEEARAMVGEVGSRKLPEIAEAAE